MPTVPEIRTSPPAVSSRFTVARQRQLEQLRQDWDDLAELDPLWAIASDPGRAFNEWTHDEFFATGKRYVDDALSAVEAAGLAVHRGAALDFGCGVGRLTRALAEEFQVCHGVDISGRMIELARQMNTHGSRCTYTVIEDGDLSWLPPATFDFVYTAEVLQHVPVEFTKAYLREFVRVLRPGGVLVFQMPCGRLLEDHGKARLRLLPKLHPARLWNKARSLMVGATPPDRYYRLRRLRVSKTWLYNRFGLRPNIEVNSLAEEEIRAFCETLGATVKAVFAKPHPELVNRLYVVSKA
jgi:2-polyprenyl-3-methyl-5-hydroxy-6-metoxy-1,4-benzoquinol methylase